MKHILFQLVTGFTLGEIVTVRFDNKYWKIVDYTYEPTWKHPFYFICVLKSVHPNKTIPVEIISAGNKSLRNKNWNKRLHYSDWDFAIKNF